MKRFLYFACIAYGLVFFTSCDKKDKDQQSGSIYGVVTDKSSGEPIKNAGVKLQPTGTQTITGEDGHYEFANVGEGTYYLLVTKSGYKTLRSGSISVANDNRQCDIQMEKELTTLQVVDDNQQAVSSIDFGTSDGSNMRSFNLLNKSDKTINWTITHENVAWIQSINPTSGSLNYNASQSVTVTIDRSQLPNTENTATVHISSAEGSKDITIKAGRLEVVETFDCSNVTGTTADLNGKLNDNLSGAVYRYGFVYSKYPDYLEANSTSSFTNVAPFSGNQTGNFTYKAQYLEKNETYYVRAFAETSSSVYYGKTVQFTTTDGTVDYYIKHPWRGGEWSWQKMSKEGNNYVYTGFWGGVGANINTSASDANADWIQENVIDGAEYMYIGCKTKFTYDPQNKSLSVTEVRDSY